MMFTVSTQGENQQSTSGQCVIFSTPKTDDSNKSVSQMFLV